MGNTKTRFKPGDLAFGGLLSGAVASAAVVFLCVGAVTTLSAARVPDLARGVVLLPAFVFAILTTGIYAFDALFRPGIVQAVGVGYLMLGNLVAAWVMGWFVSATPRDPDLVAAPAPAGGASSGR